MQVGGTHLCLGKLIMKTYVVAIVGACILLLGCSAPKSQTVTEGTDQMAKATKKIDYSVSASNVSCYSCDGTGVCRRCDGKKKHRSEDKGNTYGFGGAPAVQPLDLGCLSCIDGICINCKGKGQQTWYSQNCKACEATGFRQDLNQYCIRCKGTGALTWRD
jgi:hypothetical protein